MTDFLWGRYQPFVVAYVNKKIGAAIIYRERSYKETRAHIYIHIMTY